MQCAGEGLEWTARDHERADAERRDRARHRRPARERAHIELREGNRISRRRLHLP